MRKLIATTFSPDSLNTPRSDLAVLPTTPKNVSANGTKGTECLFRTKPQFTTKNINRMTNSIEIAKIISSIHRIIFDDY